RAAGRSALAGPAAAGHRAVLRAARGDGTAVGVAARPARGTDRGSRVAARAGVRAEAPGARHGPSGARGAALPERRSLASVARVPQPARRDAVTARVYDPGPGGDR